MNFVQYRSDAVAEQKWLETEPNMSLSDAAVFVPEGKTLSDDAVETMRHIRYCRDGEGVFVLFSDRVVAFVELGTVDDVAAQARQEADEVLGCMPDFCPYNMDDGCGLLHMTSASVYAFRPYKLDTGVFSTALEARQECLEACEEQAIAAVVFCNAEDCP